MRHVLGLDLGTNSIGWCLASEKEKNVPDKLVAGGVRIFQEAVDAKTRTPKNKSRRDARLTRRVIQRRARRKSKLRNYLISVGWLPESLTSELSPETWLNDVGNPYVLRKKGLDNQLSKEEFARVLLHLCARRGFLSNRKTALVDLYNSDDPDVLAALQDGAVEADPDAMAALSEEAKAEETAFNKEIAELRKDIVDSGLRTLGEYLADLPLHVRKRARRTDRAMYVDEFEQLWDRQQKCDPVTYNDKTRLTIYEVIFYQRPLKLKKNRRGRCSLEPSRFRAAKATLEAQEFRVLQDINNLRYIDRTTGEWLLLDAEQKRRLSNRLMLQGSLTWSSVRKEMAFNTRVKFNIEEHKGTMIGNRTVATIRAVSKQYWDSLSEAERHAFVEDLLTIQNRYALYTRFKETWQLPIDTALEYAKLEFEPGFANLSLKAIRKLLPHLRAGMIYSDARVAAGYGYEIDDTQLRDRLGEPPEARNPVVQKAMYEVRKLVNAIIRSYGKPDTVRIEMARDLKQSAKDKARTDKQNRLNKRANDQAAEQYSIIRRANPHFNLAEYPSQDDLVRYRLWRESDGVCIYSGNSINLTQLWTSAVEVDHILPFSRTLDNSYMNKVVCTAQCNRDKGNKTPFEMWGADRDAFDSIHQRAGKCPKGKQIRLDQRKLDGIDDFISRQLNDTRYISRLVLGYLKSAVDDVSVSTGAATAYLRRQWGLNSILSASGEKTRDDHRHHFVDAVVVALTNRRTYQLMATEASRHDLDSGTERLSRLQIDEPIPKLRDSVSKLASAAIVSHAINRKLSGALHEDTFRGVHGSGVTTKRVIVDSATKASDIAKIIDPKLRAVLEKWISEHGGNAKEAFSIPVLLGHGRTLRHVKIRTAKKPKPGAYLEIIDKYGNVQRRATFGNSHHVEIYKDANGRVNSRFVTTLEAASRARRTKQRIIDREVDEGGKYLFALHINDTVQAIHDGQVELYRVQKLERDTQFITLRSNWSAKIDDPNSELRKSVRTLMNQHDMVPIHVDVLGVVQKH